MFVSDWVSVGTDLTDVTLVSEDTNWRWRRWKRWKRRKRWKNDKDEEYDENEEDEEDEENEENEEDEGDEEMKKMTKIFLSMDMPILLNAQCSFTASPGFFQGTK